MLRLHCMLPAFLTPSLGLPYLLPGLPYTFPRLALFAPRLALHRP